ncbi:MAG: exodeoxyribonuclease VII large subunit [Aquihabitans sp.]
MAADSLFDDTVGGPPTWTVAELAAHIGRVTATAFPGDLWITGQIRNLKRSNNGHAYFDLAEPTEAGATPKSQLSVTLLAPERAHVNAQLKRAGGAVRMVDGIEVRIQGRLRWYEPRGTLQLRMSGIDPEFTIGRLQADRDRILAALAAEGLLEANGARPVPLVPLRIALVTSRGTAAHADVMAELESSGIGFEIRLVDARTQGSESANQITRALQRIAADVTNGVDPVDVILLVRGGGARTDLAAFDSDSVARAIAVMPVPVFTGIGHEIDRSIADEVAHTSHKTPTAAAAAVVSVVRDFLARLDDRWSGVRQAALGSAGVASDRLHHRSTRVERAGARSLARQQVHLDLTTGRVHRRSHQVLDRADQRIATHGLGVVTRSRRELGRADLLVNSFGARVRAHDPQLALARGWTITTRADGTPVGSVHRLNTGDVLVTRFGDGAVTSTVSGISPAPPPGATDRSLNHHASTGAPEEPTP